MRVLIVDDEPLARTALAQILVGRPDVEHFDSASDAIEAQEYLSKDGYDVLLLDISMPELSGLELLDRLQKYKRPLPSVVLVTAYAQHALAAFEKHAVDYVLKPFSSERVNEALDIAMKRSAAERAASLMNSLPQIQTLIAKSTKMAIKVEGRILFIDPTEVVAVEAQGNYVLLQRPTGSYLLRGLISALAEKLKPYGFLRIHRSVIVNSAAVQEIHPCDTGEYMLRTRGGKEYTVSRTYKSNLKNIAQFWVGTDALILE